MPQYWFTKHYPHPDSQKIPWFYDFADQNDADARQVSKGDKIVFYETSECPYQRFEGETLYVRASGRSRVVGIANVTDGIVKPARRLQYKKKPNLNFRWQKDCADHETYDHALQNMLCYEKVKTILKTKNPHLYVGRSIIRISKAMYDEFRGRLATFAPLVKCGPTGF